ncbi:hypothetical protein D3C72_2571640 [compost metagenome]
MSLICAVSDCVTSARTMSLSFASSPRQIRPETSGANGMNSAFIGSRDLEILS